MSNEEQTVEEVAHQSFSAVVQYNISKILSGKKYINLLLVLSSSIFIIGTSFFRGVVLAHTLSTDQFGLSVIIITIIMTLDMFADAGIDKFVVQNRFGHRSDVMRTAHAFRVVGSLTIGAIIASLSYPLSILFQSPKLFLPIAVSSGIVVVRGFVNLNYKLQQRNNIFHQEAIIDITRSCLESISIIVLALYLRNYWAVIIAGYLNAFTQCLISHRFSGSIYSFVPRVRLLNLVSRFSTPIYINATIMLLALQGDRLVVAALFTKSQLAVYTVACAISQGLIVVLNRAMGTLLLPRMSRGNRTVDEQNTFINIAGLYIIIGSTLFLIVMALFDPAVTAFVYGKKYNNLWLIIYTSSIVQMLQIENAWLTTVLISSGRTRSFPFITLMRAVAMPISIILAFYKGPLWSIPLAFAIGSAASLTASYLAARPLRIIRKRVIVISFVRTAAAFAIAVYLGVSVTA